MVAGLGVQRVDRDPGNIQGVSLPQVDERKVEDSGLGVGSAGEWGSSRCPLR